MLLITHIIIALISVVFATVLLFSPSDFKFKTNYLLLAATLSSGTYMVLDRGSHLVESCAAGLIYLAAVSLAIVLAKRKLVRQAN
jgi:hypothetical protein